MSADRLDTASLTDAQDVALCDLVHEVASVAASNAINSGDEVDFLLSNGWTVAQIKERIGVAP
jgi:hypothetical protein